MPTPEETEFAEKARRYRKARADRKLRDERRNSRRARSPSSSGASSPRSPKSSFSKFTQFFTGKPRAEEEALLRSGTFLPSGSNSASDVRRARRESGSERDDSEGVTASAGERSDRDDDAVLLENDWNTRKGKKLDSDSEGRPRLTPDALRSLDDAERGAYAKKAVQAPTATAPSASDILRGFIPKSWRTWAATASVSYACFTVGVAIGFPFATRAAMTRNTEDAASAETATSDELAMAHMAMFLGAIAGASVAGWVCDRFGRRRAIIAATMPAIAGWWAVYGDGAFSSGAIVGRSLVGVSLGLITTAAPLLLTEAAPKESRGAHAVLPQAAIAKGVAFTYFIPLAPIEVAWRHLALTCVLFNVIALVFSAIFVVESPRWYIARSQDIDAIEALTTLRGAWADRELVVEMSAIISRENAKTSPPGSFAAFSVWHLLTKSELLRAITMTCSLVAIQQFGGISLAMHNDDEIPATGSVPRTSNTRLAYVITLMIGILLCSRLIDFAGRKPCMMASLGGMCVANVVMIIVGFFSDDLTQTILSVAVVVFAFSFGIGMAATPLLISAETFPQHARAAAVGVVSTVTWMYVFVESFGYKLALNSFGARAVHAFFACACIIGLAYVSKTVPETANMTLEESVALTNPVDSPTTFTRITLGRSKKIHRSRSSKVDAAPNSAHQVHRI